MKNSIFGMLILGTVSKSIAFASSPTEETYTPPTVQKWMNIRVGPLGLIINGVDASALEGGMTLIIYPLGARKEQLSNWYISPQAGIASATINYGNLSANLADFKGQLTTGFSFMSQSGYNFQNGFCVLNLPLKKRGKYDKN